MHTERRLSRAESLGASSQGPGTQGAHGRVLLDLSSFESPKEGSDFCLTTLPTKALHLTGT